MVEKRLTLILKSCIGLSILILLYSFGFNVKKSIELSDPLKVVVYKGENYSAYKTEVDRSIRNLKYISFNDAISSFIIDEGTVAMFYRAPHYEACSFIVVGPYKVPRMNEYDCGCCTTNSNGWNNEISSIKLYSNSNNKKPGIYGNFDKPKLYPFDMF